MSTPETPLSESPSETANNTTPSQPTNPAPSEIDVAKPAETPKGDEGDLLFKPKEADGEAAKPTAAEQKQFLLDKKVDPATLEGKTDEEIAKLFDEAQAAEQSDEGKVSEYTDFDLSKLPEGIEIADDQLEWVKEYGKANNLTQEQAQALMDKGIEMQQKNLDYWNDTKKGWRDQVKADPELGGQNLSKSVTAAEAVIAKFGGSAENIKEMQDDLQLLGLGNKRSFIRFCNNIAKATSDDRADTPSGNSPAPVKNLAQQMWSNMPGDKK